MSDVRKVIARQLTVLEDRLGSGAFFRLLPGHMQIDDHLLALDIEGAAALPARSDAGRNSARLSRV